MGSSSNGHPRFSQQSERLNAGNGDGFDMLLVKVDPISNVKKKDLAAFSHIFR